MLQDHVPPACLDDLDLKAIAKVTEGHVACDLVSIVERAIHMHKMMLGGRSTGRSYAKSARFFSFFYPLACLSVCKQHYLKSYELIAMKFCRGSRVVK